MEISEIRKSEVEGQYQLKIIKDVSDPKMHRIVARFTPSRLGLMSRETHQMVNFVVTNRRLEKLANEILKHLDKQARWKAWKPTMEELERRLNETYHGEGIYMWIIDWFRQPQNKEATKRIYEWLKMAEKMGAL